MSKLNLLVNINSYEDDNPSNNPTMNHVKWNRLIEGIDIEEPASRLINLAPGQSESLFEGVISTNDDNTTTWDIALKTGSQTIYRLSLNSGTAPDFRTKRASGADATTEVTVTKNANVVTFTSTGGTLFQLLTNGAVVGDIARIGDVFNTANQGKFTIIALTETSFSVENASGVEETSIILDTNFEDQVNIHSRDGVQEGDKIDITTGFSVVTQGVYELTDVSHDYVEFSTASALPEETGIANNPKAFDIYRDAKSFVYIESSESLDIKINGTTVTNSIEPVTVGSKRKPGVFLSTSTIRSAEIENTSQSFASVFYVTAE